MAENKKWRIRNLSSKTPFCEAAKTVLGNKLAALLLSIKEYFNLPDVENLHNVRIALRRLRYTMEIFYDCFSSRKFMALYKKLEHLQDLTGLVRDLDVLEENILSVTSDNKIKIPQKFIIKIDDKKKELTETLKLELMKFYHSKSVKKII